MRRNHPAELGRKHKCMFVNATWMEFMQEYIVWSQLHHLQAEEWVFTARERTASSRPPKLWNVSQTNHQSCYPLAEITRLQTGFALYRPKDPSHHHIKIRDTSSPIQPRASGGCQCPEEIFRDTAPLGEREADWATSIVECERIRGEAGVTQDWWLEAGDNRAVYHWSLPVPEESRPFLLLITFLPIKHL